MVTRVLQPATDRPLVESDGAQSKQTQTWTKAITDQSLIIGEDSPEGVVEAPQGARYMNTLGGTGSLIYYKRDADIGGDRALGWILA